MNIQSVNNNLLQHNYYTKPQQQSTNKSSILNQNLGMPKAEHYGSVLSFTGGDSLNLAKTMMRLTPEECPPGVWERAQEVLKEGNPNDKKLIDIHKEVYQELYDVTTTNELREFFPQFRDVISVHELYKNPKANSFLDKVQKGKMPCFNPENDTTLDLVRLLYAEGASTNDLKDYTDNTSITTTVTKTLNIPLLNQHYAELLKLSDPDANARITGAIKSTKLTNQDRALQTGEPVYIPSERARQGKPLSEEHKQHISEGLIKHYSENPDATLTMSERQKQYFEENPEQKELFTKVIKYAWANSRSARKKMARFFAENSTTQPDSEHPENTPLDEKQRKLLKEFWNKNPWAKKELSTNMKKGWEKYAKIEMKKAYEYMPSGLIDKIIKEAKKEGLELSPKDFLMQNTSNIESLLMQNEKIERIQEIFDKIYKSEANKDILADTYAQTMVDFVDKYSNEDNAQGMVARNFQKRMVDLISKERFNKETGLVIETGQITAQEAAIEYQVLYQECNKKNLNDCKAFLRSRLDKNYFKFSKNLSE